MTAKTRKTAQTKPPADDPEAIAAAAQPSDPTRAGGHVLTDEGWKLAPEGDETEGEGQ